MAVSAATPTTTRAGMSLTDYLARSGERFELIDGEEIPMSPTLGGHDRFKIRLFSHLQDYVRLHDLGDVLVEATFTVAEPGDTAWVKGSAVPDVSFVVKPRFTEYETAHPEWENLPLALVPDLAVEIQSPTDRNPAILKKVAYMLSVGVQVVWVINRGHRSVTVYTAEGDPRPLTGDDLLSTDLLPGWSVTIHDLFTVVFGAR